MVALTRQRIRVISNTKCEVNITRKYRVASCNTVLNMPGTLESSVFDRLAKKNVNKNARKSDGWISSTLVTSSVDRLRIIHAHHRGGRCWCMRPRSFYVEQTRTRHTRREVSMGGFGLSRRNYKQSEQVVLLLRSPDLTSLPRRKGSQTYSKHKLRGSNNGKPNRNVDVSICNGVYSTAFSVSCKRKNVQRSS